MQKTILGALVVLVALFAVWFFFREDIYTSTSARPVSPGLDALRAVKPAQVERIELRKGKGVVDLKKEGAAWVVASSFGYPADEEKVEKLLKTLDAIEGGEEHGTSSESHKDFEVDEKKGGTIALFGKEGKELARVVVGKTATGAAAISTTRVYARFGNEPVTYRIESDLRSDASLWGKEAEGKNFLKKDLVKLPAEMEIVSMRVARPEKPDLLVEKKYREVPVEKPKEPEKEETAEAKEGEEKKDEKKEEEKPETKKEEYFVVTSGSDTAEVGKSEEWQSRSFVNRGSPISAEDAAEPKDLPAYGLDKPHIRATFSYRKKDDPEAKTQEVVILFGNEKKDEKGETQGYYAMVEGPDQKGRIYTVGKWTVEGFQKEMKDFLPKPKEEEKKDAAPVPAALPITPTPVPAPGTEGGTPPATAPGIPPTAPAVPPTAPGVPPAAGATPAPSPAPRAGETQPPPAPTAPTQPIPPPAGEKKAEGAK